MIKFAIAKITPEGLKKITQKDIDFRSGYLSTQNHSGLTAVSEFMEYLFEGKWIKPKSN